MDWKNIGTHVENLLIAALAAALIQALIGFVSYLGAHIPELLQYLISTAGGLTAILNKQNIC